jgi:hypothetical protein
MREVIKKMGTIKEEISSDMEADINSLNENSYAVKNFGLMVEGSYGDGEKYEVSKTYIIKNQNSRVKMRMFVIRNFVEMVAFEYQCSYGYAQKCVVGMADKLTLERFNDLLIKDCIDSFVEDNTCCDIAGYGRTTRLMNKFND